MKELDGFEGQNVRVDVMCIRWQDVPRLQRAPGTATWYSNKLPRRPTAVCQGIVGSQLFAMADQPLNSR